MNRSLRTTLMLLALASTGRLLTAEEKPALEKEPGAVGEVKQQIEANGGTVLKGSSFAPTPNELDEALRREHQLRLAKQPTPPLPAPLAGAYPVPGTSPAQGPENQARLLRHSARQLDEIAGQLEEFALYEQADKLREQSKQLRAEGRSLLQRSGSSYMGYQR